MLTRRSLKIISAVAAASLAAVFLWYSLRGIDWGGVRRILGGARLPLLCGAMALTVISLVLRALRWRVLLNASGQVSPSTAFQATAAGYFGNNFLPARGGELIRTFMISARSTLKPAHVLATAISERIADAVTLVLIVAVVLPTVPNPPALVVHAATVFGIGAGAALAGLAVLPSFRRRWRWPAWPIVDQAVEGVRAFHDARRLSTFAALTAVVWTLDAVSVVTTARALGLSIPLRAGYLLNAALGLGSALPSAPGYVGIFQAVAVTILPLFSLSRTDAIALILVAQALGYVVIGVTGAMGIVQYRRARRAITVAAAAHITSTATAASDIESPTANPGGS